jgi:hypothetical protein
MPRLQDLSQLKVARQEAHTNLFFDYSCVRPRRKLKEDGSGVEFFEEQREIAQNGHV